MVNRPPPRAGGSSSDRGDDSAITSSSGRKRTGPRHGLEWSLRSLHKIDNSGQHFLSNYYDNDDDDGGGSMMMNGGFGGDRANDVILEDETAYEIFKMDASERNKGLPPGRQHHPAEDSVWASLHAPLRTGIVDGKRVVFELKTDVTSKPKETRQQRLLRKHEIMNSKRSTFEVRIRFWLMRFSVFNLTWIYMGAFIAMNVVFGALFFALPEKCCEDPAFTFGQVFAFTVQTSTTIGYGSMSPTGMWQNFLVVILSYLSILMNTLFAGLLFTKFVTPIINIQFSDVMTISNVNGVPCLSFRIGNADGLENSLTDINVRMTYSYQIPYTDHKGVNRFFRQTEELKLLSSRQHGLLEAWTLRHVLDESSPLFGLHFQEHPANKIYIFTLSVDAVQELTKSTVNIQTEYGVEDILIGHNFVSMNEIDLDTGRFISDYSKISDTEPYPVWYPAKKGAYDTGELIPTPATKSFGP